MYFPSLSVGHFSMSRNTSSCNFFFQLLMTLFCTENKNLNGIGKKIWSAPYSLKHQIQCNLTELYRIYQIKLCQNWEFKRSLSCSQCPCQRTSPCLSLWRKPPYWKFSQTQDSAIKLFRHPAFVSTETSSKIPSQCRISFIWKVNK